MKREYTKAKLGSERTSKRKKPLDRLTRDVIAAQEAGMTYGKYKALHPHTPDEDDAEKLAIDPDSVVATCEYCGEEFVKPKWKTAKRFCSTTCQSRYNAKKKAEKSRQEAIGRTATCPICGASFVASHPSRVYCSTECYKESMHNRNTERWKQHSENIKKEAAKNGRT